MNTMDLPDERLRKELAGVAEVAGDGKDCPSPDTLWLSGRDELDAADNEEVVLHIAECTACASAWKLARELAPAAEVTPFRVETRVAIVVAAHFEQREPVLVSSEATVDRVVQVDQPTLDDEHDEGWLGRILCYD